MTSLIIEQANLATINMIGSNRCSLQQGFNNNNNSNSSNHHNNKVRIFYSL